MEYITCRDIQHPGSEHFEDEDGNFVTNALGQSCVLVKRMLIGSDQEAYLVVKECLNAASPLLNLVTILNELETGGKDVLEFLIERVAAGLDILYPETPDHEDDLFILASDVDQPDDLFNLSEDDEDGLELL